MKEAAHLSSSAAKELEHTVYTRLNNLGLMTEASSLVSCDLEFSSAETRFWNTARIPMNIHGRQRVFVQN